MACRGRSDHAAGRGRGSVAVSHLLRQHGEYRAGLTSVTDAGMTRMAQVRDYLDAHFHEDVTVEALARLVGLTRVHLTKNFIKHVGTPPHLYLNMVRLR